MQRSNQVLLPVGDRGDGGNGRAEHGPLRQHDHDHREIDGEQAHSNALDDPRAPAPDPAPPQTDPTTSLWPARGWTGRQVQTPNPKVSRASPSPPNFKE